MRDYIDLSQESFIIRASKRRPLSPTGMSVCRSPPLKWSRSIITSDAVVLNWRTRSRPPDFQASLK